METLTWSRSAIAKGFLSLRTATIPVPPTLDLRRYDDRQQTLDERASRSAPELTADKFGPSEAWCRPA